MANHDNTPGDKNMPAQQPDQDELNDRQNGWQANVRVDNRDDEPPAKPHHFQDNWRDEQWRETASRDDEPPSATQVQPSHPWRPNDDSRNEQRDGSAYERERDSDGNSRFHDEDHGYRNSREDARDYGDSEAHDDTRQPRDHNATSEKDYNDRNPSHERERNSR